MAKLLIFFINILLPLLILLLDMAMTAKGERRVENRKIRLMPLVGFISFLCWRRDAKTLSTIVNNPVLKILFRLGADKADIYDGLATAASCGHLSCLKLLLPVAKTGHENAFSEAAVAGHAECLLVLAPFIKNKHVLMWSMIKSAVRKHHDCVAAIIEHTDISEYMIRQSISHIIDLGDHDAAAAVGDLLQRRLLLGKTLKRDGTIPSTPQGRNRASI